MADSEAVSPHPLTPADFVRQRIAEMQRQREAALRRRIRDCLALPPAQRETWLRSPVALAAIGSRRVRQLQREIVNLRHLLQRDACSAAWVDGWESAGDLPPTWDRPHMVRVGAVRMVLSRGLVSWGGGPATPRWTPPQAEPCESMLDLLTVGEADRYSHPPSPSAAALQWLQIYSRSGLSRLRDDSGKLGRGHCVTGAKKHR